MPKETLVPEAFGALQGVRLLSTGSLIAQPFAAVLAAQAGAEVIQVERPGSGDAVWREIGIRMKPIDGKEPGPSASWVAERRNQFYTTLDMAVPDGREILLKLLERADIWMESSRPGTYAKWGLSDDEVHATNPALVIVHVSGFGQTGEPSYLGRASYDMIGQAFGGMMYQTGFPDPEPPTRANPWTGDYITALFALWSALAGYIYARDTGKGQSVDLAQFEAIHAILAGTMVEQFQFGSVRQRSGNKAPAFQPYDVFQASDGWVVLAALGTLYERVVRLLGLDPTEEKWTKARLEVNEPHGIEFDALLRGWIAERTMTEVVDAMNDAGVACSPVMSAKEMAEDPHYAARGIHIEWDDDQAGRIKGVGTVPKFSETPGKIWRGSVRVGADNQRIYGDLLGYTAEQLAEFAARGVV